MTTKYSPDPNPIIHKVGIVYSLLALVSTVPTFAWIFGAKVLPSVEWVKASWGIAAFVGLLFASLGSFLVFRAQSRQTPEQRSPFGFAVVIFGFWMLLFLGKSVVMIGWPLLYAIVAGEPTELRYVVERAEGFSDRKCRNKIELRDMPFIFDRLCRFPTSFRASLYPGQTIIVSGSGSEYGVIVAEARAANP